MSDNVGGDLEMKKAKLQEELDAFKNTILPASNPGHEVRYTGKAGSVGRDDMPRIIGLYDDPRTCTYSGIDSHIAELKKQKRQECRFIMVPESNLGGLPTPSRVTPAK
jgi:hypothetical protein